MAPSSIAEQAWPGGFRSGNVIEADCLTRRYGKGDSQVVALDGASFSVAECEAVAITGPSGSGKTTLLNLVAGLDRPTSGNLRVLGRDVIGLSEPELTALRATGIGLVFQDPNLLPGLTVLENVMVARLPWKPRRQLERRAAELLRLVGLGHRLDHTPARLSGGERQRAGIARALLGEPRLVVADEPTGNLDATTTESLMALLTRLRVELGLALLVATHDQLVAGIADRVLPMDEFLPCGDAAPIG
jgi:ABC-type lipoprotein export system ATPase subunit